MNILVIFCYLVAIILAFLASFGVAASKFNLLAGAVAFFALASLLTHAVVE